MRPLLRERLALLAVALGAAIAWGVRLQLNGYANAYYSVVAWSGAQSWRSMLFGSLEPSDVVSTDKPPLAFWLPALAIRAFGLHPWSLVLPQLVLAVVTVVVLGRTVRRAAGPTAGLIAAGAFALTPIVGVLARENEPEPLLVLLTVSAAYAVVRFAEEPRRRWLVAIGVALGCAFLTKWVVGWVVAPAVAWALWPLVRGHRVRAVGVVVSATLLSGLWWVALLVVLGPSRRPAADAKTGRLLDLVLGQNGLDRLQGRGGAAISGTPSPWRLMVPPFDQQVGWFLPLALLCLVWLLVRRPGSRATRAAVHVLGGWLLVLTVLFSAMGGAMHPYYTALLAPAIAAVMAIGLVEMWRAGSHRLLAGLLGLAIGVGAVIQLVAGWTPWLPGVAVAGGLVAVAALWRAPARVPVPAVVVTVLALAIGPVVTHAGTLSHPVVGADPHAGWVIGDRTDPYPDDLLRFLQRQQDVDWVAAVPQATPAAVLSLQLQRPVLPLSGFTGTGAGPTVEQLADFVQAGRLRYAVLLGRYTTHPTDTPPSLQGSRLARTIDWAREHGCPSQVGTYTVIDLSHGSCRPAGGN